MSPEIVLLLANNLINMVQLVALTYIAARWQKYPKHPESNGNRNE
jgi:hypothetical protein